MLKPVGVSVAAAVLLAAASQSSRAAFSCTDENNLTVCQPENDLVTSSPKDRLRQSRLLFEENNCLAGEIIASGQFDWNAPPYAGEIHLVVRYECKIGDTGLQSDEGKKQRTRESVSARYDFACALREYKYFASGFDYFNDGSRSHWDSQGSSKPIPWQKLYSGAMGARLDSLFKIWCE